MYFTEKDDFLSSYDEDDCVISVEDYILTMENIHQKPYIKTNMKSIDDIIGGFRHGQLNIISGWTSQGKTLFAKTLTSYFSKNETKCLWFTYEMPPREFIGSFGAIIPHFYLPRELKANSPEWLKDRIREAQLKFNIEAVFIDHLHYLSDLMISRNPSLEIGQVCRSIKKIAVELDISIFLIAHTGKISDKKEPGLGDARDSSFVEQEADNVFYIFRDKKDNSKSYAKIAKNRERGIRNHKIELFKFGEFLTDSMPSGYKPVNILTDDDYADDDF